MSETDLHVLIIESRYYNEIAVELLAGATEALAAAGATYERVEVPGAFEIPAAIKFAVEAEGGENGPFDGYVGLGFVIRADNRLLYTSTSTRDSTRYRMPSTA